MCGIGGFSLSANEKFYKKELDEIISKIDHRGPDDKGFYENQKNCIGLVHTRLSIQDLSSLGHQPMISADKNIVLVFNGEIYNFIQLRSELIEKGVKFEGNSDTEVLLKLYIFEGKKMLSKLNGIFDPSAVQKLILENRTGKIDASYTLLSLLCIEIWFREFL